MKQLKLSIHAVPVPVRQYINTRLAGFALRQEARRQKRLTENARKLKAKQRRQP